MKSKWIGRSHKLTLEVSYADMEAGRGAIASGIDILQQIAMGDCSQFTAKEGDELVTLAGCAFFALRRIELAMPEFDAVNLAIEAIGVETMRRELAQRFDTARP